MGNIGESRLSFGILPGSAKLVGKFDGVPFEPLNLTTAIEFGETQTTAYYDRKNRAIIYENERSVSKGGAKDVIYVKQLLADSSLADFAGVGGLVAGGLPSVGNINGELQLSFSVPTPIENNESSLGFMVYVGSPNSQNGYIRLLKPAAGIGGDSILVGRSDGTIGFAPPVVSPIVVPVSRLVGGGIFVGAPDTTSNGYGYKRMGGTEVISNSDRSPIEVTLVVPAAIKADGLYLGLYASLQAPGADYQINFVEGINNLKREIGTSGQAQWTVVLQPNQKCQIDFGVFTSTSSNFDVIIGSHNERAPQVVPPVIHVRRLV